MKISEAFHAQCRDAREAVARACGVPLVTTVEAMGYRVVPEWMVSQFQRVLEHVEAKKEKAG